MSGSLSRGSRRGGTAAAHERETSRAWINLEVLERTVLEVDEQRPPHGSGGCELGSAVRARCLNGSDDRKGRISRHQQGRGPGALETSPTLSWVTGATREAAEEVRVLQQKQTTHRCHDPCMFSIRAADGCHLRLQRLRHRRS